MQEERCTNSGDPQDSDLLGYEEDPSVDMENYVPLDERIHDEAFIVAPGERSSENHLQSSRAREDPRQKPWNAEDGCPGSRREDPRAPGRHFSELGLLNGQGKPRLNVAQGFFRRSENVEDLDLLEELYVYWRDLSEFLVLRSLQVNPRSLASVWNYVGVKSSKRGNDVYRSRVKRRLDWLSSMPDVRFFDDSDFSTSKKVYSSALWLTLTYDTKRCSRSEAMQRIGQEWNRFLSALRSKYGQVSVLRSWETSGQGYPHVHACLLFKEARFSVFQHLAEKDQKELQLQYRIQEKDQIASLWHSHVDVQAISSTRKLFNYMRKYQTKTLMASDSPKGVRTMSILWLNRKRSFSVSGDFRARLHDWIRLMHNSKMEICQARVDGSLQAPSVWEFVGVFSGQELSHHGEGWTFRLNKHQIKVVLEREAQFKPVGRFGDWD
jgi:hypothetical protein